VNSNPLLISAQKQMLLVEEVRKKKKEITVGEEVPEWQSVGDRQPNFRLHKLRFSVWRCKSSVADPHHFDADPIRPITLMRILIQIFY
jgi:hypothetical protein